MAVTAAALRLPRTAWVRAAALVAVAIVGTAGANVVGGRSPWLALAPTALVTAAWVAWRVPLRWSVAVLTALLLAVDRSSDASGVWHTRLVFLGDLLHENLDRVVRGVPLSGAEVVLVFLLVAWGWRRARGLAIDSSVRVEAASASREILILYVGALLYALANGLLNGTGPALWKLRNNLQVPGYFLLFQAALRGPVDHPLLARIVVGAACVKAALAIWIQRVAAPALTGGPLAYTTNHGDSILFTVAVFILVVRFLERPERRSLAQAALFVPLLVLGMVDNGRRTAWVILGADLLVAYLMAPMRSWKVQVTRWGLLLSPVLALYVAVGWSSGSALFAPVATLRSLGDASYDLSTQWREIENWNICMSIRAHPVAGIGLGGAYTEHMRNASLTGLYSDYRGWPHNSVLGLILLGGGIAFAAMWALFAFTVYLAARAYRAAAQPELRAAALTCIAAVIGCLAMAYGDTGANLFQYRLFAGLALAVAAKLAVATGGWPARGR